MISRIQHRHALALPFVVLALVTLADGLVNSMDARGRVVDDLDDKPIAGATIAHGNRAVVSD